MKYTSYKLIYLEIIDITFNQTLCQSLHIPQYSLNYILYLYHIYPIFISHLSHIYPIFIPYFIPYLSHIYPIFIPYFVSRIETAALATEEALVARRRCEAPRRE